MNGREYVKLLLVSVAMMGQGLMLLLVKGLSPMVAAVSLLGLMVGAVMMVCAVASFLIGRIKGGALNAKR